MITEVGHPTFIVCDPEREILARRCHGRTTFRLKGKGVISCFENITLA